MAKYKVVLDSGETRTVDSDCVTIDPHTTRFDTRAEAGKPSVMIAYFPTRNVTEIINLTEKAVK